MMLFTTFHALVISVLALASVNARPVRRAGTTYVVVAGDTCDGIAAKTGVSLSTLMSLNSNVINDACTNLEIGETLTLSNDSSTPASSAPAPPSGSTSSGITAAQLLAIVPSSSSCDPSAQFADECRTADQAVSFINAGFSQFNTTTAGEMAALVSLMAFETGGFMFDRNHFPAPGNPGQGTRNLMQFNFVLQYALDTPAVAAEAQSLAPDPTNVSDDVKNQVLALVLPDTLSFASAAWFLKASGTCSQSVVDGLQSGTESGWENYITNCVGTTVTDDRRSLYEAAVSALNV